jgi:alkylated DNA repair dioxygenase AlkB
VIAGLTYVPEWVERDAHDRLLAAADEHEWRTTFDHRVQVYGYNYDHPARSAYRIGDIPEWAAAIATRLHRDGLFADAPNQLVVNDYPPGTGIFDHQDQAVFGDVVVSLSLGSACVMRFTRNEPARAEEILLEPRSLLVMTGEARWDWKHGIPARASDLWHSREVARGRRVSLTFRAVPSRLPSRQGDIA